MRALAIFIALVLVGVAAYSAETISYTYDVHGRVTKVSHSGTVNNNVVANYTYDKADNRNQVATTGAQ